MAGGSDVAVEVEDVVFRYPARGVTARFSRDDGALALDHVSFRIPRGEVFGILGPNGAGKTTLMKILATVYVPASGRVALLGHDQPGNEEAVRARIGVSFGEYERAFAWRLTGRQNLAYFGAFYGMGRRLANERAAIVLDEVGLSDKADTLVQNYSTGMKHRLALARALLPEPEVLILDEPTAGLDAKTSRELGETIRGLAARGTTIVYTTHRIEEAASLCDRILILKGGRGVAMASPEALTRLARDVTAVEVEANGVLPADLSPIEESSAVTSVTLTSRSTMRLQASDVHTAIGTVLAWLADHGLAAINVRCEGASLTDAFVAITEGRIDTPGSEGAMAVAPTATGPGGTS